MKLRKGAWTIGGLALLAVLALWGAYTWWLRAEHRQMALLLEAQQQRSFHGLVSHMHSLTGLLGKGLVTGSVPRNQFYLGDVRHHAESALAHFAGLPLPGPVAAGTAKFLTQTADFAHAWAGKEAAGGEMGPADREQLTHLYQTAESLNDQLQALALQMAGDGFRWQQPMAAGLTGLLPWRRDPPGGEEPGTPQAAAARLPAGWQQIGDQMDQLPAFVYDGPFSDQTTPRPLAVTGPPVSLEQARERLQRYLPVGGRWQEAGVTEGNGTAPTWSFTLTPAGGPADHTLSVDLSKEGGHLVSLLNSRPAADPTLDLGQARNIGLQYLEKVGFAGMVPTYAEQDDGFAVIQYVYKQGDTWIYPDQVKVRVALDHGEVVGVDALDYLDSHRPRELPAPRISPEAAQLAVSGEMDVEEMRLALIPDAAGTGEIHTYEFRGQWRGATYLVYINAATGKEERILQVIDTGTGTFAM